MEIDLNDPETITVFTDGSAYPNPNGKGGWAFHCKFRDDSVTRYGFVDEASNNQMEIMAIVRALQFVPSSLSHTRPMVVVSDSAYTIGALTVWSTRWAEDGWRTSNGSEVKNQSLIKLGLNLITHHRQFRLLEFVKVKGHSGVIRNERADALANHARKSGESKWSKEDIRNFL
jgi:ribonuclease HI